MRYFITFMLIFYLFSCGVPQSKYEELKTENEKLKKRNQELLDEISQQKTEKLNDLKVHTEEEALRLLKDWYSFYHADDLFRKPRFRRVANNEFLVSLEECTKKGPFKKQDFFWNAVVLQIIIYEDGTYQINKNVSQQ